MKTFQSAIGIFSLIALSKRSVIDTFEVNWLEYLNFMFRPIVRKYFFNWSLFFKSNGSLRSGSNLSPYSDVWPVTTEFASY